METLESSCIAGRNVKSYIDVETEWQLLRALNKISKWLGNSAPKYIPKTLRSRCYNKNLYTSVHSRIFWQKKWKKTKFSLAVECINRLRHINIRDYYSSIGRMKCWYTLLYRWTLKIHATQKKPDTKATCFMILFIWNVQNK